MVKPSMRKDKFICFKFNFLNNPKSCGHHVTSVLNRCRNESLGRDL